MAYKAFVSSTFVDLKEHRAHVISSLRRAGFAVDPMEDWTADSDEPKKFSQERLDGCDLCVLLVAFRRGFVPDGEALSITQLEYEAAVKLGIDILPFMLEENAPWPRRFDELEKDPKIVEWRKQLRDSHGVELFGLKPKSIDMSALSRWLAKRNGSEATASNLRRIDWPADKSPYPGLLSFDQDYAELYFGRDRDVNVVIAKMSEPAGRLLIVSGASGSGKSSLIGAAVWRALIQEDRIPGSAEWEWLRIQPGDSKTSPFEALAWGLKQSRLRIAARPESLAQDLASDPSHLGNLLAQHLSLRGELVLFIDQLEELFTQSFGSDDIENFLGQLVTATRDNQQRLRVLATVRSEFVARLEEFEPILELLNAGYNYHLGKVSPRILQEMIEQPALVTGYEFEPELVNEILADAAQEPGNLPLVAYMLKQLFERRRDHTFTGEAYKEIQGVAGAIGTQADHIVGALDPQTLSAFDRVFAELVHIDRDGPPTRKRVSLAVFDADPAGKRLIVSLAAADCRVLVTDATAQNPLVEVAHEKFFTAWPRLQKWIDNGGEALRLIEHAAEAARRWHGLGQHPQELWPANRATEVTDALNRFGKKADTELEQFLRPQNLLIQQLDRNDLSHLQRALIGNKLAEYGDPRPGVGLTPEGVPDIDWVDIPAGKVTQEDDKKSIFAVKPFRIARYPVTNIQFEAFIQVEDGYGSEKGWEHIEPSQESASPSWSEANCPRETVSWFEAIAFCRWLSARLGKPVRLPTEWEWQQAATGGDAQREYPWEGEWDPARCNSNESRLNRTTAVGLYPKGKTLQGVSDMAGNVWEWCLNNYDKRSNDGSRVLRGGSWNSDAAFARCASRGWNYYAYDRYDGVGYGLAQDLP